MDNTIFESPENFRAALNNLKTGADTGFNESKGDNAIQALPSQEFSPDTQHMTGEVISEQVGPTEDAISDAAPQAETSGGEEATQDDSDELEEKADHKSHMVPKSRLNKELEKRKALEQELESNREARIRAETRLQLLGQLQQEAQKQAQQPEEQIQPQLNPLDPESFHYQNKMIQDIAQQLTQAKQEAQQEREHNAQVLLQQTATMQESLFKQQHPDFEAAVEHFRNVQVNAYKIAHGDQAQAEQEAHHYIKNLLTNSLRSGKNAAETIYSMAQNFGYKNGVVAKRTAPQTNIAAVQKNAERAASISGVGSSAAVNQSPRSMEAIIRKDGTYDPKEFHKMLKTVGQKNVAG